MKKKSFLVKVFRYDPSRDLEPGYSVYQIESGGKTKVLDLLKYIYINNDGGLSFRWSCGTGKCGACAVMVNGRPALACQEIVENEDLLIEPLANFPVIKDLIVSREPYQDKLRLTRPFLDRSGLEPPDLAEIPGWEDYKHFSRCVECLSCMSTCPALAEAPSGFAGPAVIGGLAKRGSHPGDGLDRALLAMHSGLHNCTSCKSCTESCPKGIEVFRRAVQAFRTVNAAREAGVPKLQAQFGAALAGGGKLFAPSGKPFTAEVAGPVEGQEVKEEIGLFLGCRFDARMQKTARALVNLLVAANYRVIIPSRQECCGGPLIWTGQRDGIEKQLRLNIGLFEEAGVKTVVTPCPGCGMTLKYDYPEMYRKLEGRDPGFQVKDASELLALEAQGLGVKGLNLKVTYHDPCHLKRGQHIWREPRQILASIPGVELVEMEGADRCCGGMAISANKDLADRLAAKKAASIASTNAQAVVTGCPTCQDTLRKALVKSGRRIPVYMLEDLLEMALNTHSKLSENRVGVTDRCSLDERKT